jgi:hypothetical protein
MQMQSPTKVVAARQENTDQACDRYAAESVRQNQLNLSLGVGQTGPAWSNDFRAHRNWCLQGNNLKTTPGHLQTREKLLQEFAIKTGKEAAKRYAEESVRQNEANKAMGAGYPPPSWSSDFNSHFQWSKAGNNLTSTPGHLGNRERMLQEAAIKGNSVAMGPPPVQSQQPVTAPATGVGGAIAAKDGGLQAQPLPSATQPVQVNPQQNMQVTKIQYSVRQNFDIQAPLLKKLTLALPNPDLCQDSCSKEKDCWSFTYVKPNLQGPQAVCYLKGRPEKVIENDCCTSGVKQPPAYLSLDPNSAEAAANQQKSAAYKKNLQEFIQTAKLKLPPEIAAANRRIQEIEVQRMQKELSGIRDLFNKTANAPAATLADFDDIKLKAQVLQMANIKTLSPIAPIQINKSLVQNAVVKPEVTGILSAPVSLSRDTIQEGGYVLLFGRNFGNEVGKVMLTYHTEPVELTTIKSQELAVTLEPWQGNWQQAWHDSLIIAKIPILPPGYLLSNASLTLWRDGKNPMALTVPIRFSRKGAGVHSIRAAPEYGDHLNRDAAVFGGELFLNGVGFGDQPGKIYLELTQPLNGQNRIDLLPAKGSWQQSWNEHFIYAKVPELKINAPTQTAMLVIEPAYGGQGTFRRGISFGPRLVYAMITGRDFLDLDTDAPDNWLEEYGPYLRVAHGPDCTWYRWFGSNGAEYFFKNKKLTDNTRVVRSLTVPVMPDLPWTTWDIVLNEVGDLVDAFTGGPFSLAQYFAGALGTAFGSIFDDNIGRYTADVTQTSTRENPLTRIEWYTTCLAFSPAYDVPIVYISTFLVEGPEGFCPGEIIDLEDSVIK